MGGETLRVIVRNNRFAGRLCYGVAASVGPVDGLLASPRIGAQLESASSLLLLLCFFLLIDTEINIFQTNNV